MDKAKVEGFVVGLLERHCGSKAAQSANTRRHFTDAILTGSSTPDTVRAQIIQLAQTQQLAQHIIQTSPPTSPALQVHQMQPQPQPQPQPQLQLNGHQPIPTSPPAGDAKWSKDEQNRFFEGYELFGADDVENIRAHVETRSLDEVRRFLGEYLDYLEAKRQQIKRERDERERLQRERAKEDRVRQLELELERERAGLQANQAADALFAAQVVADVGDADQARLAREIAEEERRDEALVRQLEAQTLADQAKGEAQQLRDLQDEERRQHAIELEMERRVQLLQEQLAAEKARLAAAQPLTPTRPTAAISSTTPSLLSTSSARNKLAPVPTATTTATTTQTAAAARPAQFTFSKSRAASPPAPEPAPTSLAEYELLFNNVSLSTPPPSSLSSPPSSSSSSSLSSSFSSSSSSSPSSLPYVVPALPTTKPAIFNPFPAAAVGASPHSYYAPAADPSAPWAPPTAAFAPVMPMVGRSQPQPQPQLIAGHTYAQPPTAGVTPLSGPSPDSIPNLMVPPTSASLGGGSDKAAKFEFEQVKQFVTELYRVYTGGKLPDPATFRWHVDSIMNGSYSLTQAEYSVRFSKEAKEYARQQKQKKDAQVHQIREYVKELMRVYCKRAPTEEEMKSHVDAVLSGQSNLQQVEDEVRLLGLTAPVGRPARP